MDDEGLTSRPVYKLFSRLKSRQCRHPFQPFLKSAKCSILFLMFSARSCHRMDWISWILSESSRFYIRRRRESTTQSRSWSRSGTVLLRILKQSCPPTGVVAVNPWEKRNVGKFQQE